MPRSVTLRLSDDIYQKFSQMAREENRSMANLVETLALQKLTEEILANSALMKKLKRGQGRLNCGRDDSLSKFIIFETDQFLEEMKANFRGQGGRIREKLKSMYTRSSKKIPISAKTLRN